MTYGALRVTMIGGLVEENALPALGFGWSNAPTIDEVLALAPASREWAKLQAACRRFVAEQEERRKQAFAFDEAFLAGLQPPSDPTLRALFSALLDLRQGPRAPALPLPRVRFESTPAFSAEMWVNDPLYAQRGRGSVYIDLKAWQDGIRAACTCGKGCVHVLLTIDAALAWLCNDATDVEARLLAIPPWQRLLDAIDAGLVEDQEETMLSFRVGPTGTLTAYEHKPLKRGGFSAGSRVDLPEQLRGKDPFDALVGSTRVFLESNPNRRVTVKRAEVGFSLTRDRVGLLHLRPTLDGSARDPEALIERDVLLVEDVLYVYKLKPEARAVLQACIDFPHAFPPAAERALLDRLPRLERLTRVELPQDLQGEAVVADPRFVLRLVAQERGVLIEGVVMPIGDPFKPGEGPETVTAMRDGKRVYAHRDLAAELAHARAIAEKLPLGIPLEPWRWRLASDEAALDLLDALKQIDEPVSCHWREDSPRKMSVHEPSAVRVHVRQHRDWFNLEGDIELDGDRIKLGAILEALRKGSNYAQIDAMRWLKIGEAMRERLRDLNEFQRFGPEAAVALRDVPLDDVPPAWRAIQQRLAHADAINPEPPKALRATLREYQREGYQWLSRLAAWGVGGVLADDMGLGKTVQALAVLIDRQHLGPQLVIAPLSVCFNWKREIDRFAPGLDVLVLSYGQVTKDHETLMQTRFATIVLDEAQAIKNAETQRARAVRALQGDFKFALSGTPIENHTGELWSILRVVAPGLLGSWDQFRTRFATPIDREGDTQRRKALARLIRPFVLRRTKAEVLQELPPRTEVLVSVTPSEAEKRLYEDARLAAVQQLGSRAVEDMRFEILAQITKLRLLACHPRLYDKASALPSSKLEAILRTARHLKDNGHRAIVFSQFTSHLALVRDALNDFSVLMLDGSTPAAERERCVDLFQSGQVDLFLISLKAGGFGLNLTAADDVLHLDPWWNPAVEEQATGRAHRIGQTRPVTVYRFVSQGTIEEAIMALHNDKRELVASLLDGSDSAGKMSSEALFALISEEQKA